MVPGGVGEQVHLVLRHLMPVAVAEVFADLGFEALDAVHFCRHEPKAT